MLECENCGHKLPSKEVELTSAEITDEYFKNIKREYFH